MRDYLINMGVLGVVGGISEGGIAWIVGALAAIPTLLFCANQAKSLFTRHPSLQDQFREVKDCDERCQTANLRHSELAATFDTRIRGMSEKSAQSREKIYIRLSSVEAELSAIKKENELQTQRLLELAAKFDRFIERHS